MSGKIQGEKKEKSPAAKDMEYGIDSVNIFGGFSDLGVFN